MKRRDAARTEGLGVPLSSGAAIHRRDGVLVHVAPDDFDEDVQARSEDPLAEVVIEAECEDEDPLLETLPASVAKFVLATELVRVSKRRHRLVLLEPLATCVLGFAALIWLVLQVRDVPHVPTVLFVAWFVLLGRTAWKVLGWYRDWFVATDKRLMRTSGILNRKVAMIPMSKVTDMTYQRSWMGHVFGYGELVLESAGQNQALSDVKWVPLPDLVHRRICEQIFGEVRPVRGGVPLSVRAAKATARAVRRARTKAGARRHGRSSGR
ncbi:MAG: PH domain-containing protein [Janthinobacterium lividum]